MITRVDRHEFIQRWKREIAHNSYAPLRRGDVEELLSTCLEHLLGELACPDRAGEAGSAGAALLPLHADNPVVLPGTLKLLAAAGCGVGSVIDDRQQQGAAEAVPEMGVDRP